jgi:hypothetical protein
MMTDTKKNIQPQNQEHEKTNVIVTLFAAQSLSNRSSDGDWKLFCGPACKDAPYCPGDLFKPDWPWVPAPVTGNVEPDLAQGNKTVTGCLPETNKKSTWLVEYISGREKSINHYLIEAISFRPEYYKLWYNKPKLTGD